MRERPLTFPDQFGPFDIIYEEDTVEWPNLAISLEEAKKALAAHEKVLVIEGELVVVLEGGLVQAVVGTGDMVNRKVRIIDYDTEGADEDEITSIEQADGSEEEAIYRTDAVQMMTITLPSDE